MTSVSASALSAPLRSPSQRRGSVAINGKFLSAAPTGVHRVAAELTLALDQLLRDASQERSWRVVKPRDANRSLSLHNMGEQTAGALTWQPWEQFDLPRLARRDLLLNFCNLGPLLHRSSIVMMHDAQVFSTPESYSFGFRQFYQTLQPLLGRRAPRILTVSEFSKRELERFRVTPVEKIAVIPNGCDHTTRIQSDPSIIARIALQGQAYVVGLANLQKHKNISLLLQAFSRPELDGIRLVLVGKAERADFERAGIFVPESVVFAGAVTDAEFKALYEGAICLAFPSTTEGFGLPPLEAMSVGCPTIVAPEGALPEVCGSAALYAPADDPAAWAQAISQLASDRHKRDQLCAAGRRRAAGFTWANSASELLRVIEDI